MLVRRVYCCRHAATTAFQFQDVGAAVVDADAIPSNIAAGGANMSSYILKAELLAGGILATIVAATPPAPAFAQQSAGRPDFSANNVGWVGLNGNGPFF